MAISMASACVRSCAKRWASSAGNGHCPDVRQLMHAMQGANRSELMLMRSIVQPWERAAFSAASSSDAVVPWCRGDASMDRISGILEKSLVQSIV